MGRGKEPQGGVTTPKIGRRAWWWHWVSQGLAGAGAGEGAGSACCSWGLQLTWGAAGAGHTRDRGDARFWGILKVLLCLQSGTLPPEGTSPQVTREVPAGSIPTSQSGSYQPFATPTSCSALGGLSPRHLRSPISPSATWPQPPCLGGQNQFAKHTQSLKSHWEQAGGHVTVVQVT